MLGINLNNLKLNLLSFRYASLSFRIFKFPRRNFSPACCAHVAFLSPPAPPHQLLLHSWMEFWRPFAPHAHCTPGWNWNWNRLRLNAQHPFNLGRKVYQKSSAHSIGDNSCGLELVACARAVSCRAASCCSQLEAILKPSPNPVPPPPPKKNTKNEINAQKSHINFKFKFKFKERKRESHLGPFQLVAAVINNKKKFKIKII